jgi:hypothetical protein
MLHNLDTSEIKIEFGLGGFPDISSIIEECEEDCTPQNIIFQNTRKLSANFDLRESSSHSLSDKSDSALP